MKFFYYTIKRQIEDVFIFPFILFGRMITSLFPLKKEYDIFFFFPFYQTGGAEKVNALITQSAGNKNCIIYFTRKSADSTFYSEFEKSGCDIKNISFYTDNKWQYFFNLIYRGIISGYINKQKSKPVVFNGQCNFGYKISPWINKNIPQIELIHSFNSFSWIRIPFIPFITKTVMISKVRIEDYLKQYRDISVPHEFDKKIIYIANGIDIAKTITPKNPDEPLKILYAGRATSEKRVHLVAMIAQKIQEENLPVTFTFMGDVENTIPQNLRRHCILLGTKNDADEIAEIYNQSHILIITSSSEGFPMVIMEAMSEGCAIIATPVGDIPLHIIAEKNGFLFSNSEDENAIVAEGVNFIKQLNANRGLLKNMGNTNREYALENFGLDTFKKNYSQLFQEIKSTAN